MQALSLQLIGYSTEDLEGRVRLWVTQEAALMNCSSIFFILDKFIYSHEGVVHSFPNYLANTLYICDIFEAGHV